MTYPIQISVHTKYVGKSSTHEVSLGIVIISNISFSDLHIAQKNVKLSEDGEKVLEGEDLDVN